MFSYIFIKKYASQFNHIYSIAHCSNDPLKIVRVRVISIDNSLYFSLRLPVCIINSFAFVHASSLLPSWKPRSLPEHNEAARKKKRKKKRRKGSRQNIYIYVYLYIMHAYREKRFRRRGTRGQDKGRKMAKGEP